MRKAKKQGKEHTIEVRGDVKVGDFILERGDKVKIIEAGGQKSGTMPIEEIAYEDAIDFCHQQGFYPEKEIKGFKRHFKQIQKKAGMGWTKRKDMPVIETEDVKKFQARLEKGTLDINKPFSNDTNPENPFPEGLGGFEAENFIKRGLKDGSKKDDIVPVKIDQVTVNELKPIQEQIYFDKAMGAIIEFGIESSIDFITEESFFILSQDHYIIDGHHRFLSATLIDPSMNVNALIVDLPIMKLLPLAIAYGDAIGNQRNL